MPYIDWTHTYNITYSGELNVPENTTSTVTCISDVIAPSQPAVILDTCGRSIVPVLIGYIDTPDPVTCEGTRIYTYRYTSCDGSETADWTHTYNITYSGELTAPENTEDISLTSLTNAVAPESPNEILDVCGRSISPVLIGYEDVPNPTTEEGSRIWTYRYTSCDGSETVDWKHTYQRTYNCIPYDWKYEYIGQTVSNFYWDPTAVLYNIQGAWRCDSLNGYIEWVGDYPTFDIVENDGTPQIIPTRYPENGGLMFPNQINVLLGYSISSDPGRIITSVDGDWVSEYIPYTSIYDTDWNLIWYSPWGHYWIEWGNSTTKTVGAIVATAIAPVSSVYFCRIGIKRECY